MFTSDYIKKLLKQKKFLGFCPECGMIVYAIDIISLRCKEWSKLRIECRDCEERMNVKKLRKKNPFRKIIRQRTKFNRPSLEQMIQEFNRPSLEQMIQEFIHLMNLVPMTVSTLETYRKKLEANKRIPNEEILKAYNTAGRRTQWNNNELLEAMVEKQTNKSANAMIRRKF